MQTILSGRVETQDRAERLLGELSARGIAQGDMQAFWVPPPGQRGEFPIGGDEYADRGAKHAQKGQASGVAIGSVAGLVAGGLAAAAIPPLAPVLLAGVTGVGALAGSVAGAVSSSDSKEAADDASTDPQPEARHGGLMVAVRVTADNETTVRDTMQAAGVQDIERACGEWRDGQWVDFDPNAPGDEVGPV